MAELMRYLARIGFQGEPRADPATLTQIVRRHVAAFPFEALDVQLGHPPGLDPAAHFAKLVDGGRGGWCYEQNGLLGAMLRAIGFEVTRLSAAVMRKARGEPSHGTHLALRVDLGGRWLVDAGFGGSLTRPLPLEEGDWNDGPFSVSLAKLDDGWWRFTEQLGEADPFSYDFRDEPAEEAELARLCAWQGSAGESNFVRTLVAQRRIGDTHLTLRGKVLTETGPGGAIRRELADAAELTATLRDQFGLDVPAVASKWPAILARHAELFGEDQCAVSA